MEIRIKTEAVESRISELKSKLPGIADQTEARRVRKLIQEMCGEHQKERSRVQDKKTTCLYGWSKTNKIRKKEAISVIFEMMQVIDFGNEASFRGGANPAGTGGTPE